MAATHPASASPLDNAMAYVDGPPPAALHQALATLLDARERAQPTEMVLALSQVARCYRALDALALAERYLDQALRWSNLIGAADAEVRLLCELVDVCYDLAVVAQGDDPSASRAALERMRDHAFAAAARAGHVSDPNWEVTVLLRVSDALTRCGDHDDALNLQARAMKLMQRTATPTAWQAVRSLAAQEPAGPPTGRLPEGAV